MSEMHENESAGHALRVAITTLTLGILGSSILPVPFAFSRTGIFPGLSLALIVALSNAYTGTLLLHAAAFLQKTTYEGVCHAAWRSKIWKTIAQFSLLALLFGTLAGDAALLADTGTLAITQLSNGTPPEWMTAQGRVPMLILVLGLVLPLSLSKQMRSLERAAAGGIFLVVLLSIVIIHSSMKAGFPAITNGELPLFHTSPGSTKELPEAVSVLSFAFYTTPMLLPLRSEMPHGPLGDDIMCKAVQIVTTCIAFIVYAVIGCFGAARWGLETKGDILLNTWLSGRCGGALNAAMAVYLSISMAPMVITMRYLLDSIVAGGELRNFHYSWKRDVTFTISCILSSTAVAATWPERAEKLFAVTGATAVCLVAYVIPVAVHFKLYFRGYWSGRAIVGLTPLDQTDDGPQAWLLEDAALLESHRSSGSDVVDDGGEVGVSSDERRQLNDRRDSSVLDNHQIVIDNNDDGFSRGRRKERKVFYPHLQHIYNVRWWGSSLLLIWHVVVPIVVLSFGLGVSVLALILALMKK